MTELVGIDLKTAKKVLNYHGPIFYKLPPLARHISNMRLLRYDPLSSNVSSKNDNLTTCQKSEGNT